MWSETLGYRDYRPPYLGEFFEDVALRLPLAGAEDLLDLGCGAGDVALGFAPHVASLTGVEPELPLLEETRRRASDAGRPDAMIAEIRAATAPHFRGGALVERLCTLGLIFRRRDAARR